jgi:hypothetical protein
MKMRKSQFILSIFTQVFIGCSSPLKERKESEEHQIDQSTYYFLSAHKRNLWSRNVQNVFRGLQKKKFENP